MKIGQKLKELRKSLGLSRIQFAEIIGVNPKTITFWENEKTFPLKVIYLQFVINAICQIIILMKM